MVPPPRCKNTPNGLLGSAGMEACSPWYSPGSAYTTGGTSVAATHPGRTASPPAGAGAAAAATPAALAVPGGATRRSQGSSTPPGCGSCT